MVTGTTMNRARESHRVEHWGPFWRKELLACELKMRRGYQRGREPTTVLKKRGTGVPGRLSRQSMRGSIRLLISGWRV